MEKFGVGCGCATGAPALGGMEKQADGTRKCGTCGATYKVAEVQLEDKVAIKDVSGSTVQGRKPA